MPGTPPQYQGKYKSDIVKDGFEKFGPDADYKTVNKYLRSFGVNKPLEKSMYYRFKGEAKRAAGQKTRVTIKPNVAAKISSVRSTVNEIVDTVATAKTLIDKLGKDEAKRLIDLL